MTGCLVSTRSRWAVLLVVVLPLACGGGDSKPSDCGAKTCAQLGAVHQDMAQFDHQNAAWHDIMLWKKALLCFVTSFLVGCPRAAGRGRMPTGIRKILIDPLQYPTFSQ